MPFVVDGPVHDTQCIFKTQPDEHVFSHVDGVIEFEVENTRPEKEIELVARVTQPSGSHESLSSVPISEILHMFNFSPIETGPHEFAVENFGRPIADSPRTVKISAVRSAVKQPKVVFPDISKIQIFHNQILKIPVLVNQNDLPFLVVLCTHTELEYEIAVSLNKSDPENVVAMIAFSNGGEYKLSFLVKGEHAFRSPMTFFVEGPIYDSQCVFKKQSDGQLFILLDGKIVFEIENILQNQDVDLIVKVTQPNGSVVDILSTLFSDTLHTFNFMPMETGIHKFVIENKGRSIKGSPQVLLLSAVDVQPEKPLVKFPDISKSKVSANQILRFPVLVSDKHLPHLTISCLHLDLGTEIPIILDKSNPKKVMVTLTLVKRRKL